MWLDVFEHIGTGAIGAPVHAFGSSGLKKHSVAMLSQGFASTAHAKFNALLPE
jgi:hypothetical protein